VLLLVLDTSTPAVTAGVVRVDGGVATVLAGRVTVDARAHGELLTPHLNAAAAEAGVRLSQIDLIVCGTGPGPFTGLRVGMVTAAALGHGLDRPVVGVCSLDAIAADVPDDGAPFLVVTDARRREVYWAAYESGGRRVAGPEVCAPALLGDQVAELGVRRAAGQGAALYADVLGLPAVEPAFPTPAGLAAAAIAANTEAPEPFVPRYLRRPDAVLPGAPKKVGR
jgi:tRNA threonylcarbamoyl adenosine modification protein YeaZ